jgi:hypothetical protein
MLRIENFCLPVQLVTILNPVSNFQFECSLLSTVRLSNFDRRDPKMGVFLQSTEATSRRHLPKWKLTPKNPPEVTMFMAAMAMVFLWKIVEDFQTFVKNTKLWPSLQKSVSCKKMGLKTSIWSCLKACFKGYNILFYNIFGQTIYWSTAKPWTSPKKHSNDLERSKFRQQVQSFACVPPWRRVTFEFWEMLKIPQR